jgi:hypothetical protein
MKQEEVEKWLISEANKKSVIAENYLAILNNATPEMKGYWLNYLGNMLDAFQNAIDEQAKSKMEKS